MFVEFTESVNLSKVNFSRYKLYLNELENKINYITHIITVLVYDSWSTVISSPHPVFCCFPRRPLAILGILFVGNQKHLAHISNLIEHWSHHLVCVHVHAPPGLWAPRMEKTVPHLSPISLTSSTWVGACLNEGEFRQNMLQRGLQFSALCLARPTFPFLEPSLMGRTCIIIPNTIAWNLKLNNFGSVVRETGAQKIWVKK